MKTNEMLNNYVHTHKLGEREQNAFIDSFIEALGLDLDGRWFCLNSGKFNHKMNATRDDVATFICNQLMSNGMYGLYEDYNEEFTIVEISQPKLIANDSFLNALEEGRKIVEESEKWEGI